jgi:phosphoserine phosphatase
LQSDRKLIIFDVDGVIIPIRSSWGYIHACYGVDNTENLRAYTNGRIDYSEFMRRDIALWLEKRGRIHITEIDQIFRSILPVTGMSTLVGMLRYRGHQPVAVSSGIDRLAERVSEELGIPVCLSNSLITNDKGYLTGSGVSNVPLNMKHEVVAKLQSKMNVGKSRTVCICDSKYDISLREVSGWFVAWNTKNRALISISDLNLPQGSFDELTRALLA